MARTYKRDALGRFAGSSGGGRKRRSSRHSGPFRPARSGPIIRESHVNHEGIRLDTLGAKTRRATGGGAIRGYRKRRASNKAEALRLSERIQSDPRLDSVHRQHKRAVQAHYRKHGAPSVY